MIAFHQPIGMLPVGVDGGCDAGSKGCRGGGVFTCKG